MKRRMSIKLKLTLWFTAFMGLIAAICLGLIVVIGGRVSDDEARSRLERVVRSDIEGISYEGGRLSFREGFSFYEDGVYTMVYNASGAMLGGETPPGFPVGEPTENGAIRTVAGSEDSFLIFDLFMPSGWDDGVWVRGVTEAPDMRDAAGRSATVFLIILPFIILMAAIGGYLLVRRSLRPIERITELAGSISGGKDLSKRISEDQSYGDDEAGRLARAFDQMFGRLESSFEAEKQFASDASHELRTPTAVIVTQCAYLEKYAEDTEEYREGIGVIKRQADRMSVLIDRLLDMTRLDFGTRKPELADTDLSEMLRLMCEDQDTGDRGIDIETDIEPGIHVMADAHLLSRAIANLLDNARKYGRDGGHIRVGLRRAGDEAELSVSDDGIGMDKEELDKIFRRFYQVNSSRQTGSGLGLGLSMVKQITELHGGSVSVQSEPGKGSCFVIILDVIR